VQETVRGMGDRAVRTDVRAAKGRSGPPAVSNAAGGLILEELTPSLGEREMDKSGGPSASRRSRKSLDAGSRARGPIRKETLRARECRRALKAKRIAAAKAQDVACSPKALILAFAGAERRFTSGHLGGRSVEKGHKCPGIPAALFAARHGDGVLAQRPDLDKRRPGQACASGNVARGDA